MNLIQWSYTKKYQIKAIYDVFPDTVFIFRSIGSYYYIFTTKGIVSNEGPSREDYVKMELLLNLELDSLPAYLNKKNQSDISIINKWLQKKELPDSILEVLSCTK